MHSAIHMQNVAEPFIRRKASRQMSRGAIVIFAAGTGSPFFSTDTTAALRANEMNADVIFKATMVDGVYDSDPKKNPDAIKYDKLSYIDALNSRLKVMDSTAISLCMDNEMPIVVLDLWEENSVNRLLTGENVGTVIC